jgi:hypothetical protein
MSLKDVVKEKYGQAARRVTTGGSPCCGDPITSNLYDNSQAGEIPDAALKARSAAAIPLHSPA